MPLFADYEPLRHGAPTPEGLVTRSATLDELPAMAALRAARVGMPLEAATAAFVHALALAQEGEAAVFVAAGGETVLGYGATEHLTRPGLPEGWYLSGVVVDPTRRRCGIGARLTQVRLDWIAGRANEAYYFVNERNRASLDLHAAFGFQQVARDLQVPGLTFSNGAGLLFRAALPVS